ncbi:hypothetical protein [Metabacillus malikii]|uniref:Uncharacterized protein n=1 Tax=Metabacillus malikii TaxID=1504265 RepID=A0ABT9ZM14_9BACI|nr:hypothetical protein [Metabacillus malikii]MDQ0233326.1 hypothetical protein [Metabacillus malikii]
MLNILIRMVCILSWSTVYLLPKKSLKRFFPVTVVAGLFTVLNVLIGTHYHFWDETGISKKRMWNHLALVLGPFAVGNIWIFHFSYGRFGLYILINLLNNLLYALGIIPLLEKANYLRYVKFTGFHHIILTMFESLLLYGYQKLFDKPSAMFMKRGLKF